MGWVAAVLSVVVGGARSASADVIYVDIVPDHEWFKPFFLDVDNDGQVDLLFDHEFGCVGNCLSSATLKALNGDILMSGPQNVTAMSAGVIVGPGASTFGAGGLLALDRFFGDPPVYIDEQGLWDNGLTAFAGFRFSNATGLHYGWVRVLVDETSNDITVFDFAYEDAPGTAIAAGAVPEPATMALMLVGAWGIATRRRRRRAAPLSTPGRERKGGRLLQSGLPVAKRRRRPATKAATRTYTVYVIQLSRDCVKEACALAPLYVGQTAHTPEHRFAQHKAGGKLAAIKPHRYGERLRWDLMEKIAQVSTRKEAEAAERAMAEALVNRGHRVFWG